MCLGDFEPVLDRNDKDDLTYRPDPCPHRALFSRLRGDVRIKWLSPNRESLPLRNKVLGYPGGSTQRTIVPPGRPDSMVKVAPMFSARYFMMWTPIPLGFLFFASPVPLSFTARTIAFFSREG